MPKKTTDTDFAERGTCSICGGQYDRWGNNAQPINDGRCCHDCNAAVVIPARLKMIYTIR